MKKHLIAAAVAAAVALPAAAQVTISGVIDTGFQRNDTGATATGGGTTRGTSSKYKTSTLNIAGKEDLGGGLTAGFLLRDEFTAGASNPVTWGRENHIYIQGGFGMVKLGLGDIASLQGFDGAAGAFGNLTNNPSASYSGGTTSALAELGKDLANAIGYKSPTFNGISVELGYGLGQSNSDTIDNQDATRVVAVTYSAGAISAGVGAARKDASTSVAETSQDGGFVTFQAGPAKFGISYNVFDSSATSNNLDTVVAIANASYDIGGGVTLRAAFLDAEVENDTNNSATGFLFGATKSLSKRTELYAAYTSVKNASAGQFAWGGLSGAESGTQFGGNDLKGVTFGVAHSF